MCVTCELRLKDDLSNAVKHPTTWLYHGKLKQQNTPYKIIHNLKLKLKQPDKLCTMNNVYK